MFVNLMEFLKNIGLKDFLTMVATMTNSSMSSIEFEIAENLTEEINDKKIGSLEKVQLEEHCNFVLGELSISYEYG